MQAMDLVFYVVLLSSAIIDNVVTGYRLYAVTAPVVHAEEPHWDSEQHALYYVDVVQRYVLKYDPLTGGRTHVYIGQGDLGPILPVAGRKDAFFVGRARELAIFEWNGVDSWPRKLNVVLTIENDKPGNVFNDGKADRDGRMWIGTKAFKEKTNQGGFFYFDRALNFKPTKMFEASIANGLAWNSDDTLLYFVDTPTMGIDVFDYDKRKCQLSNRRNIFNTKDNGFVGIPDGMTIDQNDDLWLAINDIKITGGGSIAHVNGKTGQLINRYDLPTSQVTSCIFGGPNLDILFVTTSRKGMTQEQIEKEPLAGSVFAILETNVIGTKSNPVRMEYFQDSLLDGVDPLEYEGEFKFVETLPIVKFEVD